VPEPEYRDDRAHISADGIQSFNSSAVMICTYAVMVPLSKDSFARASARAMSKTLIGLA
jgi:hypothetical protein